MPRGQYVRKPRTSAAATVSAEVSELERQLEAAKRQGGNGRGSKRQQSQPATTATTDTKGEEKAKPKAEDKPFSAKLTRAIEAARAPFTGWVGLTASWVQKKSEVAPVFMRAFRLWQDEGYRGGLASFCRIFDATVPTDRDGYRAHPTYQAADYLRRLMDAQQADDEEETDADGNRVAAPIKPTMATTAARLLATLLSLVANPQAVYLALSRTHGLTDNQVKRLRSAAEQVQSLLATRDDFKPITVAPIVAVGTTKGKAA